MKCINCGNALPEDSVFCQFCGNKIEDVTAQEDPAIELKPEEDSTIDLNASSKQIEEQITQGDNHISKKSKRKFVSIMAIAFATILIITGAVFLIIFNNNYQSLQNEMLNVRYRPIYFSSNIEEIEERLDKFPKNYRNIGSIENQYKQIKRYIDIIDSILYSFDYSNSESLRDSYVNLYKLDNQYIEWDLSQYLDGTLENNPIAFISGKRWSNGNYYFQIYSSPEKTTLKTNLPNNKNVNIEYTFGFSSFSDPTVLYYNVDNDEDVIKAYDILGVSYKDNKWQMRIYCHKDSNIYIFE